ncbi:MAG: SGNH/GDSL hydrolase family protein [Bacteroidota bacterium]|nr:SGNH/GDSL hydrolase family protein [Bacteroidota bacterium]MDP4196084.1 SGNH/GDSL hydrolase family protein [Bacteroidota bacterium]
MKRFFTLLVFFVSFFPIYARVNIPLDDPRISYEGLWFVQKSPTIVILDRHTENVINNPESGISLSSKPYAYTQSGVRIRFKTSSPTISLRFADRENGGRAGLHNGFAVYANGKLIAIYETLSFIVNRPQNKSCEYEIVLPSLYAVSFTELSLDSGFSLDKLAPIDKPIYAAIGTSITEGTGQQSASFLTYPFILANELGWNLYNLAVAGAHTGWPIALLLKDKKVDYITVEFGFNDWMWDNKALSIKADQYGRLLDSLRLFQKNAKIFCITPLVTSKTTSQMGAPFKLNDFSEMILHLVKQRQENGDKKLFIIYGDKLSDTKMLDDGVHLNETGARKFALKLKKSLIRYCK